MKVLFLDIETFAMKGWFWGMYEQNILEVEEHTALACISAKWLGGKHITRALCDFPAYDPKKRDDRELVKEAWALLDEADIVVAHYGSGFDIPVLNARFIAHGLKPPSTYRQIDTKKQAARIFKFNANKLDYIADYLGIGRKLQTGGYSLWKDCMAGDSKAWARMKKYNKQDVVLLEKVYERMRPWMTSHPRVSDAPDACPKCGSAKLQSRGLQRSATHTYARLHCQSCGGWSRARKSESSTSVTNAA